VVVAEGGVAYEGVIPTTGFFGGKVVGVSINRGFPNGAYCVFRTPVEGSRQGKVVLVQHREIRDSDHEGSYTVKVYESAKESGSPDQWRHLQITLKPDSTQSTYVPIKIQPESAEDVLVVAELIVVLRL
jgi:hypothetical protein